MSVPPQSHLAGARSNESLDDAEKGMYDSTLELLAPPPFVYMGQRQDSGLDKHLSPASPVHEGITPFSSVPELSLAFPAGKRATDATDANKIEATVKKPAPPKRKISRWILFELWFNTYRKFFTFVTLLNLTGIILAAVGRFPYAENHLGALVLGNLLCAILMRNELWLRFLYMFAIYGLRSVRISSTDHDVADKGRVVGPSACQASRDIGFAARGRNPLGMCPLWRWVRYVDRPGGDEADTMYRWLVYKIVEIIRYRAVQHPGVIISGIITNVFIIISVLSAFPWVRKSVTQTSASVDRSIVTNVSISTYHNVFEKHHRFIGWLGLAVCNRTPSVAVSC